MLIQINFQCTDNFGSWQSNRSGFADSDESAIVWANKEIAYARKRFSDITFTNVTLVEPDLSPMFEHGDRFISTIQ
jgi:hypothetical protein